MADWQAIKTEYITTNTSYRKLAQKYGIHYKVISERGKNEKWVELRSQHMDKTLTKTLDKISKQKATREAKIYSVSDKLLLKIEALADRPGIMPKDVRSLVGAVKDLRDILGVKSDLDKREQRARIANLEKQSKPEAKETATLIVEGLPEEFKV